MALKIRLARAGSKKRPVYRVVVTDSRNPRDGKFIERVGTHNPLLDNADANRFVVDADRVKHWLSVGAVASDRVNKHLAQLGLQDPYPRGDRPLKSKPKKKAQERLEAQVQKQKAAEEAAKEAEAKAAEAAAAPAPAEEVIEETPAAADATTPDIADAAPSDDSQEDTASEASDESKPSE